MIKHIETHTAYVTNENPRWDASNIETAIDGTDATIMIQTLTHIETKSVVEFMFQPEESFDGNWCFSIMKYQDGDRPETQKEFDEAFIDPKDYESVIFYSDFLETSWVLFKKTCIKMDQKMDEVAGILKEKYEEDND